MRAPKWAFLGGGSVPWDSIRMTLLSRSWQSWWPISSIGLAKSWVGESVPSTKAQRSSLNRGRVTHGGDRGDGVTSPSSSSLFKDSILMEGILPPLPRLSMSGTLDLPSLFMCHSFSLRARFASRFTTSSGKLTHPTAYCEHTRDPAQDHECDEIMKSCQLPKTNPNRLTPVIATPSFKGAGPTPRFRLAP
jgi:hypothetical protein